MDNLDGFIKQTAIDYCMEYDRVKTLYNRYYEQGDFYERLEMELDERRNK